MYKQFVAWSHNGCSNAPLSNYINNPVYQELIDEDYYTEWSDERIYLDLRASTGYTSEAEKLEIMTQKQIFTYCSDELQLKI